MKIQIQNEQVEITLAGVLEWIASQGGTVKQFNEWIFTGEIKGLKYRYFIAEKWIGLKTKDCPDGKMKAYENLNDFIEAVKRVDMQAVKAGCL